ncbi:diiron oxygenase, partial [Streptomyces hydrogenans]|uniref:diiron oxygenase n=1 Tax=Streptomyces hydrogenans TaxID=1873719 RepID=UPI00363A667E
GEAAYAGILVAEEVLDVMQRDWMRDERVVPFVRTINNIHVVEESRHMKSARDETRRHLARAGRARRHFQALIVAIAAYYIITSLVNPEVYVRAGLDPERARREAAANEHYKARLRASCSGLMEFLGDVGMLTRPAIRFYQRAHLL